MKSAVETLNPTRVKLTVEVPYDELKPSLDAAYKKIAGQITIPGFRRGKVPAPIIDQRVGRGVVVDEAVNSALPQWYLQALAENSITPLGQPEIDVKEFEDGRDFSFTVELDVKPKVELPRYDGIEATVDDIEVTEEDVDGELAVLQRRFGTLTTVDRAAADGDFVTINLSASKDGSVIDEAQTSDLSYQIGRGTMLDGLDQALVGMTADDSTTFESRLVGGGMKGDEVDVEVTVTQVKEQQLPELDDDFAQQASEFDMLDELRDDLRARLTRMRRLEQASAARDAILERLVAAVEVPLPDAAVADEVRSRRQSIEEQLAYSDLSLDEYLESNDQTPEEFEAELESDARQSMIGQFLLDDIAEAESISVDQPEMTQQLLRRAQQSGVDPNEYVKHTMEHGHISEIVGEVRRAKALAHIMETAKVTDASGNVVELKTLQPDGSYVDPDATEVAAQPSATPESTAPESTAPDTTAASSIVTVGAYTTPSSIKAKD